MTWASALLFLPCKAMRRPLTAGEATDTDSHAFLLAISAKRKTLFLVIFTLSLSAGMTSCGSDDEGVETPNLSEAIAGTYVGEMTAGGYVLYDTYIVYVSPISNTVASADLFDEITKFNVTEQSGVYTLKSSSYDNINISIQGRSMTMTFLNNGGTMTTFVGLRD